MPVVQCAEQLGRASARRVRAHEGVLRAASFFASDFHLTFGSFLTRSGEAADTGIAVQLDRNKPLGPDGAAAAFRSLTDLREGEQAILERLELPDDFARRLMELGFLPGSRITAARSAPGGDPRVYQVDGSEIALRRETASRLRIRPARDAT